MAKVTSECLLALHTSHAGKNVCCEQQRARDGIQAGPMGDTGSKCTKIYRHLFISLEKVGLKQLYTLKTGCLGSVVLGNVCYEACVNNSCNKAAS